MTTSAYRVRVRGRVQGVGFRYLCAIEARRLGVSGWVRNLPDGSVEALLLGTGDATKSMLAWLRHGPSSARVDAMESVAEPENAALPRDGFEIR